MHFFLFASVIHLQPLQSPHRQLQLKHELNVKWLQLQHKQQQQHQLHQHHQQQQQQRPATRHLRQPIQPPLPPLSNSRSTRGRPSRSRRRPSHSQPPQQPPQQPQQPPPQPPPPPRLQPVPGLGDEGLSACRQQLHERCRPRQATDERLHGVVARSEAQDGPGQPQDAQLGDQQAAGQRVEEVERGGEAALH